MPFYRPKRSQFNAQLASALLSGLLLMGVGLGTIVWQTVAGVQQDAETRITHARRMFERIMSDADRALSAAAVGVGQPCAGVAQLLRDQVAIWPDVRSVNLAKQGIVYCTSLYGEYRMEADFSRFFQGRIAFMQGSSLTPDRPFLVYRRVVGEYSLLAVIDGYHLISVLELLSRDRSLGLVVGQQMLQRDGRLTGALPSPDSPGYREQASQKYPFKVVMTLSPADYGAYVWHYSKISIVLFPLLSLLFGIASFKLMGRSSSPQQELRRALAEQEFVPYIQPVVSGDDARWSGGEVLMRWQHPSQGLLSPDRFIPMAEECGLIVLMTRSLMRQVCEQVAPLAHLLPEEFHFGFNISASHCKDLGLVEDCHAFIDAFRGSSVRLVLELTERELIVADEVTDRLFAELHALGVLIAIDDFGTGHASLAYLQKFQVDLLKIDQSFVGMIGSDALSSHIVENVIDLATRLGLQLVAEGVENEVQADYLRARDVTYQQGYLHARPMPIKEFNAQLAAPGGPRAS